MVASAGSGKGFWSRKPECGFTLIELLVVLAVVATLLTMVAPRYWGSADRAQEAVLRENLRSMRLAIDQYHADRGRYPEDLQDLVEKRYLRTVPTDPVTGRSDTWRLLPAPEANESYIQDVQSGATGAGPSGQPYGSL